MGPNKVGKSTLLKVLLGDLGERPICWLRGAMKKLRYSIKFTCTTTTKRGTGGAEWSRIADPFEGPSWWVSCHATAPSL